MSLPLVDSLLGPTFFRHWMRAGESFKLNNNLIYDLPPSVRSFKAPVNHTCHSPWVFLGRSWIVSGVSGSSLGSKFAGRLTRTVGLASAGRGCKLLPLTWASKLMVPVG